MTRRPSIHENFIEYLEGSLPIIISAPHGGANAPEDIVSRTNGVFDRDDYTKELTLEIVEEFFKQTNCYPHTIMMDLCRTKVDANREEKEAVSEDRQSLATYRSFHNYIQDSIEKVERKYHKGLYLDIHGQSHPHKAIEFGYLLTNDILRLENDKLSAYAKMSSIATISDFSDYSFIEQLKGDFSLGTLMSKKGFASVPSHDIPHTSKDDEYFEGAYNTKTYASTNGSSVSSIQIEFPYYCRENEKNRKETAKAMVSSILEFMKTHFNLDLKKVD